MKTVFIQEIIPSYRIPFFASLAAAPGIELTVISGSAHENEGFGAVSPRQCDFHWITLPSRVLGRPGARVVLLKSLLPAIRAERPDVVVTTGAKSFVQNHAVIAARRLGRFRLYSFQHAREYRDAGRIRQALEWMFFRWWLYPNCDGIILYTEGERRALVERGLDQRRLFYANNTIDTTEIARLRRQLSRSEVDAGLGHLGVVRRPSIVYIGRLVPGKGVEALPDLFEAVRARVPEAQLIIIGDGPLGPALRRRVASRKGIVMTGAVYDERSIACLMTTCRFVLIPGYAGLSVNHALAYGRPVVTFASPEHKPEIGYLTSGENGLILDRDDDTANTDFMVQLLTDDPTWQRMCAAALRTAERLPMSAMVANVARAIQPAAESA